MPQITLTNDQKAQLIGWLNREKDQLLSIVAICERIVTPRRTGTLDCAQNDLDSVINLRLKLRGGELTTEITEEEQDMLVDASHANRYADKAAFWRGIEEAINQ